MTDFSGYLTITKRQDHQALNGNLAAISSMLAVMRSWWWGRWGPFAVSLQGISSADALTPNGSLAPFQGAWSRAKRPAGLNGVNTRGNKLLVRVKAPG